MKHIYHCLVLLLCEVSALSMPFFVVKTNNSLEKIVIDTRIENSLYSLSPYHDLIVQFPLLIEQYLQYGIPLEVIIPDSLKGTGPLDDLAFSVEGARTILAWIKSYEFYLATNHNKVMIVKSSDFHNEDNLSPLEITYAVKGLPKALDEEWKTQNSEKKCCLITGGAGFIGSHLAKYLLDCGLRVIVVDNLICSTGQNIASLKNYTDFLFIKHDVSIPFSINTKIDYVIHAASIPSPADYYKMPINTMMAGLMGTFNTLKLALDHNARYLFLSTSEVYGDPEVHPQVESYPGNVDCCSSRAPYDQSKRGAETLIKLFIQENPLDVRIARIFNTYGPGMRLHDGRVVTNFIAALLENKPMLIYGDGNQTRSLCYIDDMVSGLISLLFCESLANAPITERVFNLGNPEEYTILQVAQVFERLAKKYLPYPVTYRKIESPDKADPRKRKPDITRAAQIVDFAPRVSFPEGLERTFLYFMQQPCNE